MSLHKWPRQYAAEIMSLGTTAERRAALARVPEHYQELVKKHVEIQFNLKKYKKR